MYFYQLVSRVCENLDRNDLSGSSISTLNNTKAGHWVNDTRHDIALGYKWSYYYQEATVNTVAASAYYPLPSDYLDHFSIFCGDQKLSRYSPGNFDENISSTLTGTVEASTSSGRPAYYVLRGMNFQIYPTPDTAYELLLRYYKTPDTFTNSTDYDHVSNLYPDIIIFGATARGARWADDVYNRDFYEGLYNNGLRKMYANEKEKEQGDAHFRMKNWRDFKLSTFGNMMRINYDGRTNKTGKGKNFLYQS